MFRLREIWESDRVKPEEFSPDAFCSFTLNDQTVLATGSLDRVIRFYFPGKANNRAPETETVMKGPILQMQYGNFVIPQKESLAILHPNLLVLYEVKIQDTAIVLTELQSFLLAHSSYNFIDAQLEGQAKAAQIVVQSLDGYLTVLNTSGPVSYKIPHFFLPGPFMYVPTIESFIFASADYRILCYRKLLLMGAQGDDKIEEWSYVFGEQVVAIHYWKTRAKFVERSHLEIAVIGERTMAVLNENGKVKNVSLHCGNAVGTHSYYSVNATNKHSSHNLIITNMDNNACIYLNFQKVWQLILPKPAIAVRIIAIPPNTGLLAMMYIDGSVVVGYLGTNDNKGLELPSLPVISEAQLKEHVMKVNQYISEMPTADHLQIFMNVSKSSPGHIEIVLQSSVTLHDVSCYISVPPSMMPIEPFHLETLSQKEQTFQIDLRSNQAPPAERTISLTATFATSENKMLTKSLDFEIPYEFFVRRVESRVKGQERIILNAEGGFATFPELFPNLRLPEPHSFSFVMTSGEVISLSVDGKNKKYRVESDSYSHLGFGIALLRKQCDSIAKATLSSTDKISLRGLLSVAKEHYNLRVQEREMQEKVHAQVMELESVQKAIIVRYEAATPEPLDDLSSLLSKATDFLKEGSQRIIELQKQITESSARVSAAVFTFINIATHVFKLSDNVRSALVKYIPSHVVNCNPGWEECTVAGITALLRKLSGSKTSTIIGSTPEFLSSFDVLEDAFNQLVSALSKRMSKE